MDISGLKEFISAGVGRWDLIKREFSHDTELAAYLRSSTLVVNMDHHQLDLDFARRLDKQTSGDKKDMKLEEVAREEFRQKMAAYLESGLRRLYLEVRFPFIEIDYIQKLKAHQEIRDMNSAGRASIRVIVRVHDVSNKERLCV